MSVNARQAIAPGPAPVVGQLGAIVVMHVQHQPEPDHDADMGGQPPAPEHRDVKGLGSGNTAPQRRGFLASDQRIDLGMLLGRAIGAQIIRQGDAELTAVDDAGQPQQSQPCRLRPSSA